MLLSSIYQASRRSVWKYWSKQEMWLCCRSWRSSIFTKIRVSLSAKFRNTQTKRSTRSNMLILRWRNRRTTKLTSR